MTRLYGSVRALRRSYGKPARAYVQQRIAQAEAVWFAGGDQWNYVSFWRDTPVDSLVNLAIQNRNIVVGGTSAGMAILGGYYFSAQNGTVTSAEALTNPYNTSVTVDSTNFINAPFLNYVITDTHFDSPNRKGRFAVFLARIFKDYGVEAKGIACDEYTAVCIDPAGGAAVYGNFPASDDNAYFIQTNCEITERNPETCTSGTPLTWNRNGTALRVYKVKGTQNGANKFRLSDWKTGVGGTWEQWFVQGGALSESAANQINCQITSTDDEVQQDFQLRIHPNPGQGEVVIQTPFPIKRVQVLNLTAQVIHTFEGNDAGCRVLRDPGGLRTRIGIAAGRRGRPDRHAGRRRRLAIKFSMMRNSEALYTREHAYGGGLLTQDIMRAYGMNPDEAEAVKIHVCAGKLRGGNSASVP